MSQEMQPAPPEDRHLEDYRLTLVGPLRVFYDISPDAAEYLDKPDPIYLSDLPPERRQEVEALMRAKQAQE